MRYLTCMIFCLLVLAGCGRSQPTLHVSGSPASGSVAVPIELDAATVAGVSDMDGSDTLVVQRRRGGALTLQQAPALSGPQAQNTVYCTLLHASGGDATFSWADRDGVLRLEEGNQPVLAYNYGMQRKEGVPSAYERSTYIHPIWAPSGTVLTDDFPEDHYHHRGLSWMWPRVRVAGATYDLWHLRGVRQVFDRWLAKDEGPVCATLGVQNMWQLDGGDPIVEERVWIRVFKATEKGRAIDVQLTLAAIDQPVQLLGQENQDKGYGGLSLRFAPRDETVITTPDGTAEEDSDHKRVAWADQSGRFGKSDAQSGVAIFQHASNPNFPAAWTLRHYGFLGVAWPGNEGMTLAPGAPVTLRYRLWIHSGPAPAGHVTDAYAAFQNPPEVHVEK